MNPDVLRLPANHDIGIHSVKLRRAAGGAVELIVSDTAILSVLPPRVAQEAARWLRGDEEEGE